MRYNGNPNEKCAVQWESKWNMCGTMEMKSYEILNTNVRYNWNPFFNSPARSILHLGKWLFSECNGNAEIGWMTFELLGKKITLRNGKQPSKVEDLEVDCNLARWPTDQRDSALSARCLFIVASLESEIIETLFISNSSSRFSRFLDFRYSWAQDAERKMLFHRCLAWVRYHCEIVYLQFSD